MIPPVELETTTTGSIGGRIILFYGMIGNWEEEKDKRTCDFGISLLLQVLIFLHHRPCCQSFN